MKYADEDDKMRTLIAKKYPFKGVDNYFTDSLLYQDPLEAAKDPSPEDSNSSNKADTEPEPEEECLWELNPLVMGIDKLDCNNTAKDVGECYINKNLDLAYLSALTSNSVSSDTSTDEDIEPLSTIDAFEKTPRGGVNRCKC